MPSVIAWVGLTLMCPTASTSVTMWTRLQLWGSSCRSFFLGMLYDIVWACSAHVLIFDNLQTLNLHQPPSLQEKPRRHRSVWIHCIVIAFKDATSFFEPQLIHSFGMLGLLVLWIYYPPIKLPRAANHRLLFLNGWFKGLKRCQLHLHWSLLHHHEASTRNQKDMAQAVGMNWPPRHRKERSDCSKFCLGQFSIPVWYSKGGSGTQNIPHVPKVVLNKIKGTHPCLIPCKHEASVLQQFNKPTKDYNHLNLWKVLTGLVPWFYFHCMICMLEASSSGGAWLSSGFHCTS